MPYITQTARQIIDDGGIVQTAGELNYLFTQTVLKFPQPFNREAIASDLKRVILRYLGIHGLSYRVINDILGALEGAKFEYDRRRGPHMEVPDIFNEVKSDFYRLVAAPYEDQKIKENGDLYNANDR